MSATAYYFWSPTCAPCKAIKPAIDDLKEEFPQVTWVSVDTHSDEVQVARQYNVSVVPTVVVEVKDAGSVISVERHSGTNIAGYYRIIRNALRTTQLL
jgi:thiol-disulfide isomerase/thioredoxin